MFQKKCIPYILFCFLILLFSSCVGVETNISFREDGSGTVTLVYQISHMVVHLGTTEGEKVVPLPVSEEDFKRAVESIDGLVLKSVKQTEDEKNVTITAKIDFQNIEAFSQVESFTNMPATLQKSDGLMVFEQVITTGEEEKIDEDSLKLVKTIFEGYSISFRVTTPGEIVSHNMGQLTDDRRTVVYELQISDLLQMQERTALSVSWES